ncbi:hypothetical protein OG709_18900 [Streptomyces sp. NBC_01267]|uniref:hypothetical protein n=1 Tax=unclassified Streptomyces TaxID=2593676 RepID=UPI0020250834|nr:MULTISPECIES: hypothetical protein [unclassified Streptomyces]MCX4549418.1 hypothetical protein [Streptomyces sp. NBC_01500]
MRRQHSAIAATATVLCLGGLVAACAGGTADQAYVAVGAAGAGQTATAPVPPSGKVTLTPLGGPGASSGPGKGGKSSAGGSTAPAGAPGAGTPDAPGTPGASGATGAPGGAAPGSRTQGGTGTGAGGSPAPGDPGNSGSGQSPSDPPATPGQPGNSPSAPPSGPAVLKIGDPERTATDQRWCEEVTVRFSNTGGSPIASGTVTFSTHVIGGAGVDWATLESSQPLPGPIAAGTALSKTYTVCVDDWRVPLGMHIETRSVSADWK